MKSGLDAVVFDWGGTLSVWAEVEMEDMWRLAAHHLAAESGVDAGIYLARLVETEHRMWAACAGNGGEASFRLVDIFEAASDEIGTDIAEAVLEDAAAHHLDTWTPHVCHDPEAAAVLHALKDLGLRVGLLSNTHWPDHFHEHFLERDGLSEVIDVRVYSSNEKRMKPHPDIFEETARRMGVDPVRTLFVGDRQYDDVLGAQQAGMRAVWKHTPHATSHPGVQPDFVVVRLSELPTIVAALRS